MNLKKLNKILLVALIAIFYAIVVFQSPRLNKNWILNDIEFIENIKNIQPGEKENTFFQKIQKDGNIILFTPVCVIENISYLKLNAYAKIYHFKELNLFQTDLPPPFSIQ